MVFNITFNNISVILWRSILLVEEVGLPRENHRPVISHWANTIKVLSVLAEYKADSIFIISSKTIYFLQDIAGKCSLSLKQESLTHTLAQKWTKKRTNEWKVYIVFFQLKKKVNVSTDKTPSCSNVTLLDDLLDYCKTLRISEGQEQEVDESHDQLEPEEENVTEPDIKPPLPKHVDIVKEVPVLIINIILILNKTSVKVIRTMNIVFC